MKITFENGKAAGQSHDFDLQEITVGREDANTLRLPTAGVSRYHAKFKQDLRNGGWFVCDQGSTNGVKVNGKRISGEHLLQENDRVMIGEQILIVSSLSAEAPLIAYHPVMSSTPGLFTGAAPGTAASTTLPAGPAPEKVPEPVRLNVVPEPEAAPEPVRLNVVPEPEAAPEPVRLNVVPEPEPQENFDNQKLLDAIGKGSLFGGREAKENVEKTEKSAAAPRKRGLHPVVFYAIVASMIVIVIASFSLLSSKSAGQSSVVEVEKPLSLYFEKLTVSRDNVFRFSLSLENNKAIFHIDDIKSRRHPEGFVIENPAGLEVLRGCLKASSIWTVKTPETVQDDSGVRRRFGAILGDKSIDLVADGHRIPPELEEVEKAVYEFAEGCGMQTISMSGEEILRMATDNFNKAEDLYANREADGANLRDAITRYRTVVNYLSEFSPPQKIWKYARERLAEAEKLRQKKLDDLEYERVRLQNVRDFESLRRVFLETMELTEQESKEYNIARKRLHLLDVHLKKQRGSR